MINAAMDARDLWKLSKWGKFSASEIVDLTIPGEVVDKITKEKALFGDTALSYINRVARECYTLFNEDENPQTYAMKMGVEREAEGAGYYQRYVGINDMVYYGVGNSKFFLYNQHAGSSPDSILWLDEPKQIASFGAEGKNPSPKVHDFYLDNIKTQADLKQHRPEYYAQIQFSMLCFKCNLWHWYSHNIYFTGKERLLIIEVQEDKNFQNDLTMRLKKAIKLKLERIENHKQRLNRLS